MLVKSNKPVGRLMLDSRCTFYMTPFEDRVKKTEKFDQVNLADDSTVNATCKVIRAVLWNGKDGFDDVHLSETLVVLDLAMILLSIPSIIPW